MQGYIKQGLIVSCYLDSMRGCEKQFIAAVANTDVVALRVEGIDNIKFARYVTHKPIIGLIKKYIYGRVVITPEPGMIDAILDAGADIVATGAYEQWLDDGFNDTHINLMLDLSKSVYAYLCRNYSDVLRQENIILATTYENKAFDFVMKMRSDFPNSLINLEGGIESYIEIKKGFIAGADYVTIGKAINDPRFIVQRLLAQMRE